MKKILAFLTVAALLSTNCVAIASDSDTVSENEFAVYEQSNDESSVALMSVNDEPVYDFKDPMYMSDEDFFGEYDSVSGTWTNLGKIDYDSFPLMNKVKEAVMDGDYESAKDEYKEYFIQKRSTYNISLSGATTKAGIVAAHMVEHQMLYNTGGATPIEIFTLGNEEKTVSIDFKEDLDIIMAQTLPQATLILVGLAKDGSSAEIYPREAEAVSKRPYVEATINGVVKRIEASGDTYISSGANANTNYSSDSMLKVEESVSSMNPEGAWENALKEKSDAWKANDKFDDENTKRTYLTFDFSTINPGDTISGAVLKFTGTNVAGTGNMDIVLFRNSDTSVEEGSLTWATKANGATHEHFIYNFDGFTDPDGVETIYYGRPYRASDRYCEDTFRFESWHNRIVNQYAETGEEYYGYAACKMFGDFVKVRGGTPGAFRTLDLACRLGSMPTQLCKIITCKYMTAELFTAIAKMIWANCDYQQYTFRSGSNWGSFQLQGLFAAGAMFREFYDYDKWVVNEIPCDVNGNPKPGASPSEPSQTSWSPSLSQSAAYRLKIMLNNTINDDFGSTEKALGYVSVNINLMLGPLSTAAKFNVPFPYSDEMKEALIKTETYFRDVMGPGNCEIQWGDAGAHTSTFTSGLESFIGQFPNDSLLYSASEGTKGTKPDYTSVNYPDTKVAVMRNGWDDLDYYMHTSYDSTGVHTHNDDLSMIIMAKGKYLLSDQMYGAYNSSDGVQAWCVSAEAHNIVKIDETYTENGCTMNNWLTNDTFDFFAATKPFSNGTFKRNIFFIKPNYWIVTDYLTPTNLTKETTYRQLWHMPPDAGIKVDEDNLTAKSSYNDVNLKIVPVENDGLTYDIRVGKYGGGTTSVFDADYVNYMKTTSGVATYNTILRPESADENSNIETEMIELPDVTDSGASAMKINLTTKGQTTNATYYLVNDMTQKKERTVGDYSFNGKMFFMEKGQTGAYKNLSVMDGDRLMEGDSILLSSKNSLSDLSVEYSNKTININTSSDIDLTDVTFKKQGTTSKVKLNGEDIAFKQTANYIYFGSTPIISDDAVAPTPNPGGGSSSGGSNHGSSSSGNAGSTVTPGGNPIVNPETRPMSDKIKDEIAGHWAENEIKYLYEKYMVNGDDNGSLCLKDNITRAELSALIVRALDLSLDTTEAEFSDISGEDWYTSAVATAAKAGIVHGYEDNSFRPNNFVTRGELATILANVARSKDLTADDRETNYVDLENSWSAENAIYVSKLGLMNGMGNNYFSPENYTLREEVMAVVYRLLSRLGQV